MVYMVLSNLLNSIDSKITCCCWFCLTPSYSSLISAFRRTSSRSALAGAISASRLGCDMSRLQIGQSMNVKVIRGPGQRRSSAARQQRTWKACPQSSRITGAADRASEKQIMHMSSASWRSGTLASVSLPTQPCRHGRQGRSSRMPPQKWPQARVRVHEFLACSIHSGWEQTAPGTRTSKDAPDEPQNL